MLIVFGVFLAVFILVACLEGGPPDGPRTEYDSIIC